MPQLISVAAACPWAFLVTYVIVKLIHFMPGINLRLNESEEQIGNDWIEIGEANCSIVGDSKSELNSIHRLSFTKEKCGETRRETVELKNVLRMSSRFKNTVEPMENSNNQMMTPTKKIFTTTNDQNQLEEIRNESFANNNKSSSNRDDANEKF